MSERNIRYHSSDDMEGLGEFAGMIAPVGVVLRADDSIDVYGLVAVVDQTATADSPAPDVPQPVLRLPLPGLPATCGHCGGTSGTWPLTTRGNHLYATCPRCWTVVAPVVAVAQ